MKKSILEIYALLVCLGSIACAAIWLGIGSYSLIGIASPETTLDVWTYQRHQSNDRFIEAPAPFSPNFNPSFDEPPTGSVETEPRPSAEELSQKRLASYQQELDIERRNSRQSLIQSLIVMIIALPLFFSHWRLARPRQP